MARGGEEPLKHDPLVRPVQPGGRTELRRASQQRTCEAIQWIPRVTHQGEQKLKRRACGVVALTRGREARASGAAPIREIADKSKQRLVLT
jgi:hypothetical protein